MSRPRPSFGTRYILLLLSATMLCMGQQCAPEATRSDVTIPVSQVETPPKVTIKTAKGTITMELFSTQAPKTVANFLQYVNEGFYNDTVFHAASSSSIFAGAYTKDLRVKSVHDAVANESNNGLLNLRGRVALFEPDGAGTGTSQFVIYLADDTTQDYDLKTETLGRTVFGRITDGMSVADAIGALPRSGATAADGTELPDLPEGAEITTVTQVGVTPTTQPAKPPSAEENRPPTAKAQRSHTTASGLTVRLDATESTDPNADDPLTFAWQQTAGPTVQLSDPVASRPTFVAPAGPTSVSFTLTVTDFNGATSTDSVTIEVIDNPAVRLLTNKGVIVLNLLLSDAPITTKNFLQYAEDGFYDGTIFHRILADPTPLIIQGGAFLANLNEPGGLRSAIQNEFSPSHSNVRGTVAAAKLPGDPNSATSQFFINLADNSANFDNQNGGSTVFATVTVGMDVADQIAAVPLGTRTDSRGNLFDNIPVDNVIVTSAVITAEGNRTPVAKAEENHQTPAGLTVVGLEVQLDGSGSSDADDGDQLTFAWEQTAGTTVQLNDTTVAKPTFVTPVGPTSLSFVLTVTDLLGATSTESVTIDVVANPKVRLTTTKGDIVMEMLVAGAPNTTSNFMQYVKDHFYDGTIFHRVAFTNPPPPDVPQPFVIQGGGFLPDLSQPEGLRDPIQNEFSATRSNIRGSVGMAKTSDPDSATSQFFINMGDNSTALDDPNNSGGFTVFATVVEGMDVADQISQVATGSRNDPQGHPFNDVPLVDVVVNTATME